MEKGWVKIYETGDPVRAEMARQILADSDIEAVVINKKDSAYGFGELELYVSRDRVIRAKNILKEL